MHAMILRTMLLGASVLLTAGVASASPVDDCNQTGDLAKQIDGCTQFLQHDPAGPYVALVYGRRGAAYQSKGDLNHAIADFTQAIEVDPNEVRFYVNRGIAYRDKGDLDKALEDFDKA